MAHIIPNVKKYRYVSKKGLTLARSFGNISLNATQAIYIHTRSYNSLRKHFRNHRLLSDIPLAIVWYI